MIDRVKLDTLVTQYLDAQLHDAEVRVATGRWHQQDAPLGDGTTWNPAVHAADDEVERLQGALLNNDLSEMRELAGQMLPGGSGEALAVLARRLLEAKIQALNAELGALNGAPLRVVNAPHVAPAPAESPPPPSPMLSAVADEYISFKMAGRKWTGKTASQMRNYYKTMVELVGDRPVREVTKAEMRELYRLIPQMPTHANKRYPDMTAPDAIAAAEGDGNDERLSPKTQNEYFTHVKSLWKWAMENDYVTTSPAVVLRPVDQSAAWDQRPAFTDQQLHAYFGTLRSPEDIAVQWIPRLMLFAGLRTEEAAKLVPEDIREEEGVWVLDINSRHGRLKTKNAARLVPVHGVLLPALLDHVRRAPKGANLWGLEKNARGIYSSGVSKRLNTILDRACPDDDRLVCYCLRHTFATRLKHAGVSAETLNELLGHAQQDLSMGRYGKRYPVANLSAAVRKLELPGLPLGA